MQFLLVPLIAAALIGLLTGGDLRRVANVDLRSAWIPLAMLALQLALVLFPRWQGDRLFSLRPGVTLASYALLIGFIWANRRLSGMKLVLAGAALNLAVIAANGGHMPVTLEALAESGHLDLVVERGGASFVLGSKDIVLPADETRLVFLSDVLKVPEALVHTPATFSPGDLLIAAGASWLVYRTMTGKAHTSQIEDKHGEDEHAYKRDTPSDRAGADRAQLP